MCLTPVFITLTHSNEAPRGWGLICSRGKRFPSSTAPRQALGPSQPPTQWGRGMKLIGHLSLVLRLRMVGLYLQNPTHQGQLFFCIPKRTNTILQYHSSNFRTTKILYLKKIDCYGMSWIYLTENWA